MKNPFRSRVTYSSRLMESAYSAGHAGKAGQRGDEHFEDWLEKERRPDLHSGFVRRLREEYFRGMAAHEQERETARSAPATESAAVRTNGLRITFKGFRIEPDGDEYAVPSLDPESRFESPTEAKRFITACVRHGGGR